MDAAVGNAFRGSADNRVSADFGTSRGPREAGWSFGGTLEVLPVGCVHTFELDCSCGPIPSKAFRTRNPERLTVESARAGTELRP
jgi:hypothetical protein